MLIRHHDQEEPRTTCLTHKSSFSLEIRPDPHQNLPGASVHKGPQNEQKTTPQTEQRPQNPTTCDSRCHLQSPTHYVSVIAHREASLIKKEYCRCGPHPLQVISSRARPYLLRERATLAAFSRISGVGHSGS